MPDPLVAVVGTPENQKKLREALQKFLDKGEDSPALKFYRVFIMPRAAKLVGGGSQVKGNTMTQAQQDAVVDWLVEGRSKETENAELASQPSY